LKLGHTIYQNVGNITIWVVVVLLEIAIYRFWSRMEHLMKEYQNKCAFCQSLGAEELNIS
jgi:hypothetical protein